ncbi:MAG: Mitochondrial inner membrane organizing system component [Candelaria pacifica]|nr:MAG: Mitochondrial inner membrane organizing system component [Candelaria pacifica]
MSSTTSTASQSSPPAVRQSKPASEALLNEKWDHAISSMLIRSTLGLSFGVIFSVLLFKRRAWPAWVGLGFGAGRSWEEADAAFKRGDTANRKEGLRVVRP